MKRDIIYDIEVYDGIIEMPEWLAEKKELI